MSDTPESSRASSLLSAAADVALGRERRIGSTVYGTLLVMAALTASYAAERHEPLKLVELVVCAVTVFWLAYVYAHALSESIQRGARIDRALLRVDRGSRARDHPRRDRPDPRAPARRRRDRHREHVDLARDRARPRGALRAGIPLLARRAARWPRNGRDPRRESPPRGRRSWCSRSRSSIETRRRRGATSSRQARGSGGLDEPDLARIADVVAQLRREDADDLEPPPLDSQQPVADPPAATVGLEDADRTAAVVHEGESVDMAAGRRRGRCRRDPHPTRNHRGPPRRLGDRVGEDPVPISVSSRSSLRSVTAGSGTPTSWPPAQPSASTVAPRVLDPDAPASRRRRPARRR